jgi:hypothetical protein
MRGSFSHFALFCALNFFSTGSGNSNNSTGSYRESRILFFIKSWATSCMCREVTPAPPRLSGQYPTRSGSMRTDTLFRFRSARSHASSKAIDSGLTSGTSSGFSVLTRLQAIRVARNGGLQERVQLFEPYMPCVWCVIASHVGVVGVHRYRWCCCCCIIFSCIAVAAEVRYVHRLCWSVAVIAGPVVDTQRTRLQDVIFCSVGCFCWRCCE